MSSSAPVSQFQNIKFEKKNAIAYVTVDRPKVLNALNMQTMDELRQAFTAIRDDREIRVAIMTGGGEKAFVAGADISELAKNDPIEAKEYTHRGQAVLDLIENCGKPVIACINGFALGGGCELVAGCDIVIASDRARFGQPEIKLGVFPPVAAILLSRIVGERKAREMILMGEMIDANEAFRFGLVTYVVPNGELEQKTTSVLTKLRELSSSSVTMTHAALELGASGGDLDSALEKLENFYLNELMKTEDAQEGVRAFMEKRKPVWRNR